MHFLGRFADCQISAASSWAVQAESGQEAVDIETWEAQETGDWSTKLSAF
jgi:hypothetical protein